MRLLAQERGRAIGEVHLTTIDGDITPRELARILAGDFDASLERRIVARAIQRNLVTNVGREDITSRIISGAATTIPGYIAVGTTVIAPAATDTTLAGELLRKACSTVAVLSTYYQRYVVNFTTTDFNNTVRGLGLFTAAAAGRMWAIVAANVTKDATQALVGEWRIQTLS